MIKAVSVGNGLLDGEAGGGEGKYVTNFKMGFD